jgi:hypothetical protein
LAFGVLSGVRDFFHHARNFEARDEGWFRCARMDAHALKQVGKVDSDCFHADQNLSRFRLGVGQIA